MKSVLQMYDEKLNNFESIKNTSGNMGALQHVRWMCQEILQWEWASSEGAWPPGEKANRWLGFIQGVLFTKGVYTIDEMREHNR